MKLAVMGGGGVRSIFLAKSLVQQAGPLHIDHIVFMDNDAERLHIFGGLAQEVARRLDDGVRFELTLDPVEAVRDADYVITTMRVGQDDMRVQDERIALASNVLGQETTGAGGFSMALRSVPALAEYCRLVRQYAKPSARVFNFTNPAGLVSQTLRDMGFDFTYGICDAPSGLLHSFAKMLHCRPEDFVTECYGLNHLSYFKHIYLNGEEITERLLENDDTYCKTDMRYFEKELARNVGMVMNEYLYYYYYREQAVENIQKAGRTRGEVIREINRQLLAELRQLDPHRDFEQCLAVFDKWYGEREDAYMQNETGHNNGREKFHFDIYSEDAGGYAGVALSYIRAAQTGTGGEMIICVPNNGAIEGLLDTDVVEVTCTLDAQGCTPKRIGSVDPLSLEWIRRVKIYERLASQAIIRRDRRMAVDALMMHPLVNSYSIAKRLADEYLRVNKPYCGEWD